jgi:beta-glucosidase
VVHHLLLAHALGVQAFRADPSGEIGLVVNLEPKDAGSTAERDRMAVERAHAYQNRLFLDPLFLGEYPKEVREMFGSDWPSFPAADLRLLQANPGDFLGVNYYTRSVVRHDDLEPLFHYSTVAQPGEHTEMDWEVYPAGLRICLRWVQARYGDIPLYVTENGAAFADVLGEDGKVHDARRIEYLRTHLSAALEAIGAGVKLRGYFAWSLLDNFEWSLGYAKRFGLIHVDHFTQQRTPKDSARFYAEVVASRGASLAI